MSARKKLPSLPEPEPWKLGLPTGQWLVDTTPGCAIGSDAFGTGSMVLHVDNGFARAAVKHLGRLAWLTVEQVAWIPARSRNEVRITVVGNPPAAQENPAA